MDENKVITPNVETETNEAKEVIAEPKSTKEASEKSPKEINVNTNTFSFPFFHNVDHKTVSHPPRQIILTNGEEMKADRSNLISPEVLNQQFTALKDLVKVEQMLDQNKSLKTPSKIAEQKDYNQNTNYKTFKDFLEKSKNLFT